MAKLPKQPIKGLIDGINVLQAVAASGQACTVTGLSADLGLEKTRVHRILGTLAHLGILHRNQQGQYAAGAGMHVLAAQSMFSSGLIRSALPYLARLGETGFTVGFGVLWKNKVSFFYHQGPGLDPLESLGRIGLYEATRSSVGMVLLAEQQDERIRELYAGEEIPGYASIAALLKALAEIRIKKFADVSEKGRHHSLAVPLGFPALAGIALAGKMNAKERKQNIELLKQVIIQIDGDLSHE